MKNIIYLFSLFFVLACSSDDENTQPITQEDPDPNPQGEVINGGTIFTNQIVTLPVEGLEDQNNETFSADFNGVPITLKKAPENNLVFILPGNVIPDNYIIQIEGLDNYKVSYTVEVTELTQSIEETIEPFFTIGAESLPNLNPDFQSQKAIDFYNSFVDYYNSLDEASKMEVALFYSANRELIDSGLIAELQGITSTDVITDVARCKSGIYLTGILGVATSISTAAGFSAPIGALIGAATGITLAKTIEHCGKVAVARVVNTFVKVENFLGLTDNLMLESLEFNNDETLSVPVTLGNRTITIEDSDSTNEIISAFFNYIDTLTNTVVNTLNSAITNYNTLVPEYFNVSLFDTVVINSSDTAEEFEISESDYNNLSFSVSSNNINIEEQSFVDGNISFKLKIVDESNVENNVVNTELNFTYTDDFNNVSGSVPISINLNAPEVMTIGAAQIESTLVRVNANVTENNSPSITLRGVVYSTEENPTIEDSSNLANTGGYGEYSVEIITDEFTTYYIRAYVETEDGIYYGNQIEIEVLSIEPLVTIESVSPNSSTSLNVTVLIEEVENSLEVMQRGVVYSLSPEPTTSNQTQSNGTGYGEFEVDLTVQEDQLYYIRGYAITSEGTTYGNEVEYNTEVTDNRLILNNTGQILDYNGLATYSDPDTDSFCNNFNLEYGIGSDLENTMTNYMIFNFSSSSTVINDGTYSINDGECSYAVIDVFHSDVFNPDDDGIIENGTIIVSENGTVFEVSGTLIRLTGDQDITVGPVSGRFIIN